MATVVDVGAGVVVVSTVVVTTGVVLAAGVVVAIGVVVTGSVVVAGVVVIAGVVGSTDVVVQSLLHFSQLFWQTCAWFSKEEHHPIELAPAMSEAQSV